MKEEKKSIFQADVKEDVKKLDLSNGGLTGDGQKEMLKII
jgi:hypothetical protein